MYSFSCDYSELAHPDILKAMTGTGASQDEGYGEDKHTQNARALIQQKIGRTDIDVHFIPGGTQANMIAICAFLRPHEAVIAAETAHICVHETGAVEATGHKICTAASQDGKITPAQIENILLIHEDEHMVKPKLVKISNATEVGTVYSKAELAALSACCRKNDLYLYCDGARLGSALMSEGSDLTLRDMADLTDAFYIGGTKNGALLGEAVVIVNGALKPDFRYFIKQRGALLAKGKIMGIQFEVLFQQNLYFDLAQHANEMAAQISRALKNKGYPVLFDSVTNQIFPVFRNEKIEELRKDFIFLIWRKIDDSHTAVRLVTSWATREEDVRRLIDAL